MALRLALLLTACMLVETAMVPPAVAQVKTPTPAQETSAFRAEAETLGWNMLIGGFTASVVRGFRGESIWRGFYEGAAGGAVMFGSKRLAAEQFSGAGLLGRQVAGIGASVVRNSSMGDPLLSELVLPVGLIRLYVRPGDERPVTARLDLASSITTLYAVLENDVVFAPGASLSAGTPIFYRRADSSGGARHLAGVVWLPDPDLTDAFGLIFAHERIHVLQYDSGFVAAALSAERSMLDRTSVGQRIGRFLDLGINVPPWAALNLLIDYERRPWEREAHFLTTGKQDNGGFHHGIWSVDQHSNR